MWHVSLCQIILIFFLLTKVNLIWIVWIKWYCEAKKWEFLFEICVFKHAEIFITYIKHMFNTLVELTDSSYKKDARIFLPLRLSCICGWSCGGSCGTVAAVNRAKNALGFLKLLLLVRLIGPPTNRVIYCENEEEERAEFSCVALFMWSFFFFLLLLVVPLRLSRIRNYMQSLFAKTTRNPTSRCWWAMQRRFIFQSNPRSIRTLSNERGV